MAPFITLGMKAEFTPSQDSSSVFPSRQRTLLLSPPSLSSHPEKLNNVLEGHDRSATDIQMLDRLCLSLISLPESTYDIILILLDTDIRHIESQSLLTRDVLLKIIQALKSGGRLQFQDPNLASHESELRREAIFAGFIVDAEGLVKPYHDPTQSVPLRFGKKKGEVATAEATSAIRLNLNGKRKNGVIDPTRPAGVGFVDFSDDRGTPGNESDDDDELIDENTLLDEDDFSRSIIQRTSLTQAPSSFLLNNVSFLLTASVF